MFAKNQQTEIMKYRRRELPANNTTEDNFRSKQIKQIRRTHPTGIVCVIKYESCRQNTLTEAVPKDVVRHRKGQGR